MTASGVLVLRKDTAEIIRKRNPIEGIVLDAMIRRGEARVIEEAITDAPRRSIETG